MPLPRLKQLQVNPPRPATAKLQGMEIEDRLRRTGIAEDRNAIAKEGMGLRREAFEFKKMKQNLAISRDFMPTIVPEEMDSVKDHFRSINVPSALVDMLPSTAESIKMHPDKFKDVTGRLIMGTDNFLAMEKEQADAFVEQIKDQMKRNQTLKDESRKRAQKMEDFKEKEDYKAKKAKEKPSVSGSYDKNLLVAAQSVGIDPEKVKSGKLSKEEAISLAEAYKEQFGTENLIRMLFGAGVATGGSPQEESVIQFDENGELMVGEAEEEKIIIRNKMPTQ